MKKRQDVKAKPLGEEATTGRRRAQVQEVSSRQRDAVLRNRRLALELADATGAPTPADGEAAAAALRSLGADALAAKATEIVRGLHAWAGAGASATRTPDEVMPYLRQLATVLSAGESSTVQAALDAGIVTLLGQVLQQPSTLPAGASRYIAWVLELLASSWDAAAAQSLLCVMPLVVARLCAALGVAPYSDEAEQWAAVLGAVAGKSQQTQAWFQQDAVAVVLQLLLASYEAALAALAQQHAAHAAAADSAPGAASGSMDTDVAQSTSGAGPEDSGAGAASAMMDMDGSAQPQFQESVPVRCTGTALWALAMMVRGRPEHVTQLLASAGFLTCVRRLLLAPPPPPAHGPSPLAREVAWLLTFCTSCGPEAVEVVMQQGGVVPGLLSNTVAAVRRTGSVANDPSPSAQNESRQLQQTLLPHLHTLTNLPASPPQALQLLTELLCAERPQRALEGAADAGGAGGGGAGPGPASAMQAVIACFDGRMSHRGVVRAAAAFLAALAWAGRGPSHAAAASGATAAAAVSRALLQAGAVPALAAAAMPSSGLDIRKEAAAALVTLCEGSGAAASGAGAGGGGGDDESEGPSPDGLAALRTLGFRTRGTVPPDMVQASAAAGEPPQEQYPRQLMMSFLGMMRSPDADAVHLALRFVNLVLRLVRHGPQVVEECDGIDALEAVQYGTSGCRVPQLQAWAEDLVDRYYGEDYGEGQEEEDEDDANMG